MQKLWPSSAVKDKAQAARSGAVSTVDLPGGSRLVLIPDPTLPYAGMSLTFTGGDAPAGRE